jgi:TP901 family phage tail tape measure protein
MSSVVGNIVINVDTSSVNKATAAMHGLNRQLATSGKNFTASSGGMQQLGNAASFLNSTGNWSAGLKNVTTQASAMNKAFDDGNMTFSQWRQTARKSPLLNQMAAQRVKTLQTQYVNLGKSVNGVQKTMAIRPTGVLKDWNGEAMMASQRSELLRRRFDMMSHGMINWGKNTQWAGRQLMVGVGIPLGIAASAAVKSFKEMEDAAISFKRVYGDLDTSDAEKSKNLTAVTKMATDEMTRYGIDAHETVRIGAEVAATGAQGADMMAATEETMRLATLGQMDYQVALESTVAVQNAFGVSSKNMGRVTDFLNATENQTILSMEDMARAIPRVGTTIKGLGGDVEDLAVMMTALRAGGVTAEQGANALKSGLASLINPTNTAVDANKKFGISINEIVESNKGDLTATIEEYGDALMKLSKFDRQRVLEETFGKYQYARMSALFENMKKDQAQQTKELSGMADEQLNSIAERELDTLAESPMIKMQAEIEKFKASLVPLGKIVTEALVPVMEFFNKIMSFFSENKTATKIALFGAAFLGIIGVVTMLVGVFANLIGTVMRVGVAFKRIFTESGFRTQQDLEAQASQRSLASALGSTTDAMYAQATAARELSSALKQMSTASNTGASGPPAEDMTGGMGGSRVGRVRGGNWGAAGGTGMGNEWGTPVMQYGAADRGEARGYRTSGEQFTGPSWSDQVTSASGHQTAARERTHLSANPVVAKDRGTWLQAVYNNLSSKGLIQPGASMPDKNVQFQTRNGVISFGDFMDNNLKSGQSNLYNNRVLGFSHDVNQGLERGSATGSMLSEELRMQPDKVLSPMYEQFMRGFGDTDQEQFIRGRMGGDVNTILREAMNDAAEEFSSRGSGTVSQADMASILESRLDTAFKDIGKLGTDDAQQLQRMWELTGANVQYQRVDGSGKKPYRSQMSAEMMRAMGMSDEDIGLITKMNYKTPSATNLDNMADAYGRIYGEQMDAASLTHDERIANQFAAKEYINPAEAEKAYWEKKSKRGSEEDRAYAASRADEISKTLEAARADLEANINAESEKVAEAAAKVQEVNDTRNELITAYSTETGLVDSAGKSEEEMTKFDKDMAAKFATYAGYNMEDLDKGQNVMGLIGSSMNDQNFDFNSLSDQNQREMRNFIESGRPDLSEGQLDRLMADNNADNEQIKSLLQSIVKNTAEDMSDSETRGARQDATDALEVAQGQEQVMKDIRDADSEERQKGGFWRNQWQRVKDGTKSTARGYKDAFAGRAKLAYHHRAQGVAAAAGAATGILTGARMAGMDVSPKVDAAVAGVGALAMVPGLITALLSPWGLLIGATVAAVGWFKYLNNKAAEAGETLAKFNVMTSDTISIMSENFRGQNLAVDMLNKRLKAIELRGKDKTAADKWFETEEGKKMRETYFNNQSAFGSEYADKILYTNLSRAITQKSINYKQADGMFKSLFGINFRWHQSAFQKYRESEAGGGGGEFRLIRRKKTGDNTDYSMRREESGKSREQSRGWKDLHGEDAYWGWHRNPVDQAMKNFKSTQGHMNDVYEEAQAQERSLWENLGIAKDRHFQNFGDAGIMGKIMRLGIGLPPGPLISLFVGEGEDGVSAFQAFNDAQTETVKRRAQMAATVAQMTKMMYEENLVAQHNVELQDEKLKSMKKELALMRKNGQAGTQEYKLKESRMKALQEQRDKDQATVEKMDDMTTAQLKTMFDEIDQSGTDTSSMSIADLDQFVETSRTLLKESVFGGDEMMAKQFDVQEAMMRRAASLQGVDEYEQQRTLAHYQNYLYSHGGMDGMDFVEKMFPTVDEMRYALPDYSTALDEVFGGVDEDNAVKTLIGPMQYFGEFMKETTGGQIQETFGMLAKGFDKVQGKQGKSMMARLVFGLEDQQDWKSLSDIGSTLGDADLGKDKQKKYLANLALISSKSNDAKGAMDQLNAAAQTAIDTGKWEHFNKLMKHLVAQSRNVPKALKNWDKLDLPDWKKDDLEAQGLDPTKPNLTAGWYEVNGTIVHFNGRNFTVYDPDDPKAQAGLNMRSEKEEFPWAHDKDPNKQDAGEASRKRRQENRQNRRDAKEEDQQAKQDAARDRREAARAARQAERARVNAAKQDFKDAAAPSRIGPLQMQNKTDVEVEADVSGIAKTLQDAFGEGDNQEIPVTAIPDLEKFRDNLEDEGQKDIVQGVIRKLKKNKSDDVDTLSKKDLKQTITRKITPKSAAVVATPPNPTNQNVPRVPNGPPALWPSAGGYGRPDPVKQYVWRVPKGQATGGFAGFPLARAGGGKISGSGGPTQDKIPAMLSNGEYVIRASSVARYGSAFMHRLNTGQVSDEVRFLNQGGGVGTTRKKNNGDSDKESEEEKDEDTSSSSSSDSDSGGDDKDNPAEDILKTSKLNKKLMKDVAKWLTKGNKSLGYIVALLEAGDMKLYGKMKKNKGLIKKYNDNLAKEDLFAAIGDMLDSAKNFRDTFIKLGKKLKGVNKKIASYLSVEQISALQAIKVPKKKFKKKNGKFKKDEDGNKIVKNRGAIKKAQKQRDALSKKFLESNIKNLQAEIALSQKEAKFARQAEEAGVDEQTYQLMMMLDKQISMASTQAKNLSGSKKMKKLEEKEADGTLKKKQENKLNKLRKAEKKAYNKEGKLRVQKQKAEEAAFAEAVAEFQFAVDAEKKSLEEQHGILKTFGQSFGAENDAMIAKLLEKGDYKAANELVTALRENTEQQKQLEDKLAAIDASQSYFDDYNTIGTANSNGVMSLIGGMENLTPDQLAEVLTPENLAHLNSLEGDPAAQEQFIANIIASSEALEGLRYATMNATEIGEEMQSAREELIGNYEAQAQAQADQKLFGSEDGTIAGSTGFGSQQEMELYEQDQNEKVRVYQKEIDEINEQYEAQQKILDKIGKAQQYIANIEKGRLNVANALAKGDMFAAAQAMQTAKAEMAKQNLDMAKQSLQEQQEARVDEIQDKIDAITDELEELNAQVDQARRDALRKYIDDISTLQQQINDDRSQDSYWEAANKALDNAISKAQEYYDAVIAGNTAAAAAAGAVNVGVGNADEAAPGAGAPSNDATATAPAQGKPIDSWKAAWDKISNKKNRKALRAGGWGKDGGEKWKKLEPEQKWRAVKWLEEKKFNKLINTRPKNIPKMRLGGFVPGFGNTDSVLTKLTPGEFVVRKGAAGELGNVLKSINKPGYKFASPAGTMRGGGDVVHGNQTNNYSVTVNAGSSANADEIADITIRKIKGLESRNVRTMGGWR